MIGSSRRSPSVLIASDGEWFGRSLESVLGLNGYAVTRVAAGSPAIEVARDIHPDALLLDDSHADLGAAAVCRALRDDPTFDHATPIIVTSSSPSPHRVRTEAYAAGAWDFCNQPLDVETFLLKLSTFIRAKRELAVAQSLVDPTTGLYTSAGLQQWASKLGARALRKREAFSCLAVTMSGEQGDTSDDRLGGDSEALVRVADLCQAQSRKSDVVGYIGGSQFVILAPDTDGAGVTRLITRLRTALAGALTGTATTTLRAGYCTVSNFASTTLDPTELLRRAQTALQQTQLSGAGSSALSFDELPQAT